MTNSLLARLLSFALLSIYITHTEASSDSLSSDSDDEYDACDVCVESAGSFDHSLQNCTLACAGKPIWNIPLAYASISAFEKQELDIAGAAECLGNYCFMKNYFDLDGCVRGSGYDCAVGSDRDIAQIFSDYRNFDEMFSELITLFGGAGDGLASLTADSNDDSGDSEGNEWSTVPANACQRCIIQDITQQPLTEGCDPIQRWCSNSGVRDSLALEAEVIHGSDTVHYESEGACYGADCCTLLSISVNGGNSTETVLCGGDIQTIAKGTDYWFGVLDKHEIQFPNVEDDSDGEAVFAAAMSPFSKKKIGAFGGNGDIFDGQKSSQGMHEMFKQKMADMREKHRRSQKQKEFNLFPFEEEKDALFEEDKAETEAKQARKVQINLSMATSVYIMAVLMAMLCWVNCAVWCVHKHCNKLKEENEVYV